MQKKAAKNNAGWANIRVSVETKKIANSLLKKANHKTIGRKIKINALLKLALENVSNPQIELLKKQSLSNEDRKEELRLFYVRRHGNISRDGFTGFMMTPEYFEFLSECGEARTVAQAEGEVR